jgi:hypothetical protein
MKAGFAAIDITPALGGQKIGWIKPIPIEAVADPLFARVAVFAGGHERLGFVQLDTLSVRWSTVQEIRRQVAAACGLPAGNLMVAATHNHSGPAVATVCDVARDDAYIAWMMPRVVQAVGAAVDALEEAEIGFASVAEFGLTHNRRTALRDGTTTTHGLGFRHPLALYVEGPIDPEVAVLAARRPGGALLGALVNFACHPVHRGGEPVVTAGFPGVLAAQMAVRGCPHSVFLNGACGNLSPGNPLQPVQPGMEDIGRRLAEDAFEAIEHMTFLAQMPLGARQTTVQLPYRCVTDAEVKGAVRGAQRFVDPTAYDRAMPRLLERIRERGTQPAEVQVLRLGEVTFTGIPAEFFVQLGLRIKEAAYPGHGLVVTHANGMVGYVPHREAFARGGYETTFGPGWRLAPEAGDLLVGAADALLRSFQEAAEPRPGAAAKVARKPAAGKGRQAAARRRG